MKYNKVKLVTKELQISPQEIRALPKQAILRYETKLDSQHASIPVKRIFIVENVATKVAIHVDKIKHQYSSKKAEGLMARLSAQ